MEEGVKVWAAGGPELWRKGSVSKRVPEAGKKTARITVVLDEGGTAEFVVSDEQDECADVKLRNVAGQASTLEGLGVEDLTSLTHLHEPTILYSLNQRYQSDLIYTGVGPILLAVNPFKRVQLYTDEILAAYRQDGERRHYDPEYDGTLAPHVYAIADKAYRNMTAPSNEYEHRSQVRECELAIDRCVCALLRHARAERGRTLESSRGGVFKLLLDSSTLVDTRPGASERGCSAHFSPTGKLSHIFVPFVFLSTTFREFLHTNLPLKKSSPDHRSEMPPEPRPALGA